MKTKIRLLKSWTNDGKRWPSGQLLETDPASAKTLVGQKVASYYDGGDFEGWDGLEESELQKRIEARIETELRNFAKIPGSGRRFHSGGNFASEGFGPVDPKAFWLGEGCSAGSMGDFTNAADFCRAVVKSSQGQWDSRLKDLAEGTASEGGFTVPDQMADFIWREVIEDGPFFSQSTLLPMHHSSMKIPLVMDVDRSGTGGMHGVGIPTGVGEAEALADISPSFGLCELNLHKIGGRCRISNELLEDSKEAMSVLLPSLFADALSWEMQRQFISGTGAGQCLGIMNAPALVTVAAEDAQPAKTILYENIVSMWSRLLPRARKTAVWLINPDAEVQVRTMSLAVGTGGSSAFILNTATSLPETIFGRPCYFTEHCQTLGTTGDIICCNPRAYGLGHKPGDPIRIESSTHIRFENDQTVFRAVARLDGQPLTIQPITPANSTETVSHFVALESR